MLRPLAVLVLAFAMVLPAIASAAGPRRLTLAEITAAALENPLADAAHESTNAARARVREIRGGRLARLKFTGFVAPSPEINCVDAACTETSPRDVPINVAGVFAGAQLSAVQPITTFGKATAVVAAASSAAEASAYGEDMVAGDLAYQAARAYYGLKLARELIWMLEDGKEEIGKGHKTLVDKLAAGASDVTVQDRLRLETLAAEVDARLSEAREAEATALAGIRALVGDPTIDIDEDALTSADFELGVAADYVVQSRAGHPQLKAARAGVAAREHMVSYQKRRYRPDLVLVGSINVAYAQGVENPPSAFANDPFNTTSGALGVVLRWQIDPLSQPARVDRARAEARRAAALMSAASQLSEFEVRRAYASADQASKRYKAAKRGEKAARGWVASVLQADAVGTASAKDLADAYLAYFSLHGRVLQSAYDWNLAIVGLRHAVGEFTAAR